MMKMANSSGTFSVRLPDALRDDVDALAELTKRSRSYIVKEAVAIYMKDRTAYLRDLNEAVADAESGYGHSAEQVFDWMNTWGTEDETSAPAPDIRP
jgi:predicted transcriptional regulator